MVAFEAGSRLYDHIIDESEIFRLEEEFETGIFRTRDGTEKRRAFRNEPRKRIRFASTAADDCFRGLVRDVYAHQREPWIVRDRSRRIFAVAGMAALGSTLEVATAPYWLAAGETVILTDRARVETRVIDSVAAGVVTFTAANDGAAWPVGTEVSPAFPGRMASPVSLTKRIARAVQFRAEFFSPPGIELARTTPAAADLLNGFEFFSQPIRVVSGVDARSLSEIEVIDFDRGRISINEPILFPTSAERLDYGWRNAACITEIQDLFYRVRGRLGRFYMPTFDQDFTPAGESAAGNNILTVAGDVDTQFDGSTVFDALAIQYADNSWGRALINSMALVGQNTQMVLSANLPQVVNEENVKAISWLPLRRFGSDRLVTEWRREYARASISIQTLESS